MRGAGLSSRAGTAVREVAWTWRRLSPEQRVAGVAATLLVISTFGPFSFVEAAIVLVALAVLALLRVRAEGRRFHLPFGDGTVIAAAGAWCGLLILIRVLDRPLGQNLLALGCALLLFLAGARERAKRPADDLPQGRGEAADAADHGAHGPGAGRTPSGSGRRSSEAETRPLGDRRSPRRERARPAEEETLPLGDERAPGERPTRALEASDVRPSPRDPPELPDPRPREESDEPR